ncbi:hypothetical protein DCCM_3234 [Desulfocucumis palustris]|uniref:Phage protein n=1 Tax=Desulfocucumis palustris TaxID=1898651 RepID=A0A2L2XDA9_9FIRM|nr:phage protein GemA/Gp16 family protein [Desulfocucumis palustris]GBF34122.1 hypothetical protein DCCM_3234 [Desulfocucumis palustris]
MSGKITAPQIKKLYITAKQLGMDDEDLHGLVYNMTRSEHISKMTKTQAGRIIDYLSDKLNRNYREEAASKQQLYKIHQLAAQLGWSDNPNRLAGFIKKTAGVEREQWLTAAGAYKVIEGLKKILQRQGKNEQKA